MERLKVAHIINHLKPGGGERFLVDVVCRLRAQGFDVHVFSLYGKGDLASEVEKAGVPVEVIGVPRRFGPEGYRRVYGALRGRDFQVLHCHLLAGCWYGLPAGWAAGIPVRIAHLQNSHWRLSLKSRILDRLAFQFAHAAFACSQAVIRFYTERMWYPPSKLYLVHNSVNISRFEHLSDKREARSRLGLTEDEVVLTTVASLTPQKGHRYLLRAVREIVAQEERVKFLFVGEGELRDELEAEAKALGVAPWVRWLGKRLDVPEILAASDILVLPSLWEGLPMVLIEAGLAGLPVVASKVDGTVEMVENGKSGFLVPPQDVGALAEACLRLIRDPNLRTAMGEAGRKIARERFSIERAAEKIATLYRLLLNSRVK